MCNYIYFIRIQDLINNTDSIKQENLKKSVCQALDKKTGVIIIHDEKPSFNANKGVINFYSDYPFFKTYKEFIDWLNVKLELYWVPTKSETENIIAINGPYSLKEATEFRDKENDDEVGKVFHAVDKKAAEDSMNNMFN